MQKNEVPEIRNEVQKKRLEETLEQKQKPKKEKRKQNEKL